MDGSAPIRYEDAPRHAVVCDDRAHVEPIRQALLHLGMGDRHVCTVDDLPLNLTGCALTVATGDPVVLMSRLVDQGVPAAMVRAYDFSAISPATFGRMIEARDATILNVLSAGPMLDPLWEESRPAHRWDADALEEVPIDDWILGDLIRIQTPSIMLVVGPTNQGKSTFSQNLLMRLVDSEWATVRGATGAVFALEDSPQDFFERITALKGGDARTAMALSERISWIRLKDGAPKNIDRFFAMIRLHVRTRNAKFVILDPWNEIDHEIAAGDTETTYVQRVMTQARALTKELGVFVVITTHVPGRVYGRGGKAEFFSTSQARGSSHFADKADYGVCVMRMGREPLLRKMRDDAEKGGDGEEAAMFVPGNVDTFGLIVVDKVRQEKRRGKRGAVVVTMNHEREEFEETHPALSVWATRATR